MQVVRRDGKAQAPVRVYCSDAAGAITYPDGTGAITFDSDVKVVDLVFAATFSYQDKSC